MRAHLDWLRGVCGLPPDKLASPLLLWAGPATALVGRMVNLLKLRSAITFHPIAVAGSPEPGSFLAFSDTRLVAVVICRAGSQRSPAAWFVEAGFGPCAEAANWFFDTAEEAQDWVREACGTA